MAETTSGQLPNGTPAPDTQPADSQASATEKTGRVNLHELPEFRQVQAANDRRMAQMEQQYRTTVSQLQQQLDTLTTRDMSDEERSVHQQNRMAQYVQNLEQQLAQERAEQARWRDLARISGAMQTSWGITVPINVMEPAADPAEATELATKYVAEQLEKQRKADQRAERKEANQVDVGGGKAVTPDVRENEEYRDAKSSIDIARIRMRQRADAAKGR